MNEYEQALMKEIKVMAESEASIRKERREFTADGVITIPNKYFGSGDIIYRHGRFYVPVERPKGFVKMQDKMCYKNATQMVWSHPGLTYVEGFAVLRHGLTVIPHAWVADKNGNAIDVTWEEIGLAYFGIPFTTEYLNTTLHDKECFGTIHESQNRISIMEDGFPDGAIAI